MLGPQCSVMLLAHALLQPRRHLLHIWASVSCRLSGRHPCSRCRYRHRPPSWYGAIHATPFLPTQTGPAPPCEDATGTSGRESRQRGLATPAPGRKQGAGRTPGGTARPPRRPEGDGRAGGRRARAARVELSSILGGLTARTRGTRAHLRQSFHPPLPASRLEGASAGVGARRVLGIVAAIWGRRGMVSGTGVINQTFTRPNDQGNSHPSPKYLRTRERKGRV